MSYPLCGIALVYADFLLFALAKPDFLVSKIHSVLVLVKTEWFT